MERGRTGITRWIPIRYGPGTIHARMNGTRIEAQSMQTGEPCAFDDVTRNMLIEDTRRGVCIQVAAACAERDPDLRWKLCQPKTLVVDYTKCQLQGKAAVILLQAARAYADDYGRKLGDLTRTSWADLVKMIPGEKPYEP